MHVLVRRETPAIINDCPFQNIWILPSCLERWSLPPPSVLPTRISISHTCTSPHPRWNTCRHQQLSSRVFNPQFLTLDQSIFVQVSLHTWLSLVCSHPTPQSTISTLTPSPWTGFVYLHLQYPDQVPKRWSWPPHCVLRFIEAILYVCFSTSALTDLRLSRFTLYRIFSPYSSILISCMYLSALKYSHHQWLSFCTAIINDCDFVSWPGAHRGGAGPLLRAADP